MSKLSSSGEENTSNLNLSTTFEALLVALACTFLIWYIQFLWGRRKIYECSRKLPGPLALPIIGCALEFIGSLADIASKMMTISNQYPETYRIWFGPKMFCVTSHPKHFEILLPNFLEKDPWHELAAPAVGNGLFSAPYKIWKKHRKLINPTFNQKILNGFVGVFSEQSQELVEQLRKVAGKGEFDVLEIMSRCTLNIICETVMGFKLNDEQKSDKAMSSTVDTILKIIFLRAVIYPYHSDFIFNLTKVSKRFWNAVHQLHTLSGTVVREKKRLFEEAREQQKDTVQVNCEEGPKRKVLLDYLIEVTNEDNTSFTERELRDEVDTFIVAGSDTTASTSSFIFLALGLHQDMQQKVYEETLDVIGPDRAVESDDLANLKYMERFIKEALRLFPVGAFLVRNVQKDVNLGDCVVPKGTSVILSILKAHTNEKYWPDPFKFDPDRFLPEEIATRHPCTYLPFSYGPRSCVGAKYAMMAMKSILATVLRKFRFSTSYKCVQDVQLQMNMVLRPKDGYKVSLELR